MKKTNPIIYITSFLSGMTVMAVELSCSRLLAPYFSSSSIVWTVVIGLIMICLSAGNILGGRSADKHKSLNRLYFYIWIAAIWVALIPFIGKYLISLIIGILVLVAPGGQFVLMGSAISCLVIFSLPMILLGMVSPYLVKLGIQDMESSGKVVGQINAMNTIGSIIGTFIPTFVTIPLIGTGKTFLLFSFLLNIVCALYFLFHKKKPVKQVITTVLVLAFLIVPYSDSFAYWKTGITYEGESVYNYLQVSEDEDSVILSTNVAFGVQSIYKKDGSLSGYYYEYALMAPFFMDEASTEKDLDVLVLGLGTGTYSKQLKKYFKNAKSDAVEIDGKIAWLAEKYFNLRKDEATVYINDGRSFLSTKDAGLYDVILADAYQDITVPFHMSTVEFFTEVKKHLKPGGILIVNINMKSGDFTGVPEYLSGTLKKVFKYAYRVDLEHVTNSVVFVSDNDKMLTNYANNIASSIPEEHDLYKISRYVAENTQEIPASDLVLTDDLAPVEVLGKKSLDKIVARELEAFSAGLKGKSLKEILQMVTE